MNSDLSELEDKVNTKYIKFGMFIIGAILLSFLLLPMAIALYFFFKLFVR
jgi:hypothetical protein